MGNNMNWVVIMLVPLVYFLWNVLIVLVTNQLWRLVLRILPPSRRDRCAVEWAANLADVDKQAERFLQVCGYVKAAATEWNHHRTRHTPTQADHNRRHILPYTGLLEEDQMTLPKIGRLGRRYLWRMVVLLLKVPKEVPPQIHNAFDALIMCRQLRRGQETFSGEMMWLVMNYRFVGRLKGSGYTVQINLKNTSMRRRTLALFFFYSLLSIEECLFFHQRHSQMKSSRF